MKAKIINFKIQAERDFIFFGSSLAEAWPAAEGAGGQSFNGCSSEALLLESEAHRPDKPAVELQPLLSDGGLVLKGQTCFIGRSKAPLPALRRLTDFLSCLSGAATLAKCFAKGCQTKIFASPTKPLAYTESAVAGQDKSGTAPAAALVGGKTAYSNKPVGAGQKSANPAAPKSASRQTQAASSARQEASSSQNQTAGGLSLSQPEAEMLRFWEQKALLSAGAVLEPPSLKIFQDEKSFLQALNNNGGERDEGGKSASNKPVPRAASAKTSPAGEGGAIKYFCFNKSGFSLSRIKALASSAKLPKGAQIGIGGVLTVKDCARLPNDVFQFARPDLLRGNFPRAGMILKIS